MTTATQPDSCRITVINEILHTRKETVSPQSVKDALENQGDVAAAALFINYMEVFGEKDRPIGVCVRHDDGEILIRWHPALHSDPESARAAMLAVLDNPGGSWDD